MGLARPNCAGLMIGSWTHLQRHTVMGQARDECDGGGCSDAVSDPLRPEAIQNLADAVGASRLTSMGCDVQS